MCQLEVLDISFISKMLSDDKIIAICSKGIEIGPRALFIEVF